MMILGFIKDLFFSTKLEEMLKKLGHPVTIVSGEEAFAAKLQEEPSLIIIDLTMDGVDLERLLKSLREDQETAKIPILGYTTHVDWKRSEPLKRWCSRMVTKDMLSKDLPSLIQKYLER